MKAFIKAIDQKVWHSILTSWNHPTTIEGDKVILKSEVLWSIEEDRLANNNSKTFNAIFNVIDANKFNLISTCESTKEVWNIH